MLVTIDVNIVGKYSWFGEPLSSFFHGVGCMFQHLLPLFLYHSFFVHQAFLWVNLLCEFQSGIRVYKASSAAIIFSVGDDGEAQRLVVALLAIGYG